MPAARIKRQDHNIYPNVSVVPYQWNSYKEYGAIMNEEHGAAKRVTNLLNRRKEGKARTGDEKYSDAILKEVMKQQQSIQLLDAELVSLIRKRRAIPKPRECSECQEETFMEISSKKAQKQWKADMKERSVRAKLITAMRKIRMLDQQVRELHTQGATIDDIEKLVLNTVIAEEEDVQGEQETTEPTESEYTSHDQEGADSSIVQDDKDSYYSGKEITYISDDRSFHDKEDDNGHDKEGGLHNSDKQYSNWNSNNAVNDSDDKVVDNSDNNENTNCGSDSSASIDLKYLIYQRVDEPSLASSQAYTDNPLVPVTHGEPLLLATNSTNIVTNADIHFAMMGEDDQMDELFLKQVNYVKKNIPLFDLKWRGVIEDAAMGIPEWKRDLAKAYIADMRRSHLATDTEDGITQRRMIIAVVRKYVAKWTAHCNADNSNKRNRNRAKRKYAEYVAGKGYNYPEHGRRWLR